MLCWNVYYGDFNSRKIEVFNVFNHWSFYDNCVRAAKKYKDDKEGFAGEVRSSLMYFFWGKCEWETVLHHWPDSELYEMRTKTTIGELRDALREHGIKTFEDEGFRTKPEREVTIRVYPNDFVREEKKIDVYDQIMNNWEIFIDYLWEHRKELKARKRA